MLRAQTSALILFSLLLCSTLAACRHRPLSRSLETASYYFDNTLPFQPNRIWRLKVSWEPYLLDAKKAIVLKQYNFIVHDDNDRRRLEATITAHGGDQRYLRWLETELFPLGNWEKRDDARVARYQNLIVVVLGTKAIKEVPRKGYLSVSPVQFPDPLLRAIFDGCHELNWDVISKDESVGFEVVLESRDSNPGARKWKLHEYDSPAFWWRAWSVGQGHSIAYRTAVKFKTNVARCPLPPKLYDEFKLLKLGQEMGVDW